MPGLNQRNKKNLRSKLLEKYLDFLRENQCLSESTIIIYRPIVSRFLSEINGIATPSKIHRLSPATIHDYIIKTFQKLSRSGKKQTVKVLRSFLRFAYVCGYLKKNLSEVVPVITIRNLEGIPRKISWKDVDKLLSVPDRKTAVGRRNYAILLLIATYGVRIGQVKSLTLKDIKWHEGVINFNASKGGKPLSFPLEENVAEALLEYIKKDRKEASYKEVFLTVRGPKKPLGFNNRLASSLIIYYRKAKIISEIKGSSHAIRHALATRLMEKSIPIKTISDILGHRWIETTFIYTKVDVERLRILVREWPEAMI